MQIRLLEQGKEEIPLGEKKIKSTKWKDQPSFHSMTARHKRQQLGNSARQIKPLQSLSKSCFIKLIDLNEAYGTIL